MTTVSMSMTYGEAVGPCQVHFGPSPSGRYGSMVDPNGHKWLICAECISYLWQEKQAMYQAERTAQERAEMAKEFLGEMIERHLAELLTEGLEQ